MLPAWQNAVSKTCTKLLKSAIVNQQSTIFFFYTDYTNFHRLFLLKTATATENFLTFWNQQSLINNRQSFFFTQITQIFTDFFFAEIWKSENCDCDWKLFLHGLFSLKTATATENFFILNLVVPSLGVRGLVV